MKSRNSFVIYILAGKLPCHMLAFPKNTMACDLAGRMAKIIDYMGNKCDTTWNQIWGGKVRELVRDSMPSDGSACSSEPIDSSDGKILALFRNSYAA